MLLWNVLKTVCGFVFNSLRLIFNFSWKKFKNLCFFFKNLAFTSFFKKDQNQQKIFLKNKQINTKILKDQSIQTNQFKNTKQSMQKNQQQIISSNYIKNELQIVKQTQDLRLLTKNYQQQLMRLRQQSQRISNPEFFLQSKKKIQKQFILNINKIQIQPVQKSKKCKKFIIGPISAGKSSIIKHFLKVNVLVGIGQTTLKVQKVYQNDEAQVYDSPGINKDYDITKFTNLAQLFSMNQFYICYKDSLKNVKAILQILSAISNKNGQKIYLIRTHCDYFQDNQFSDQSSLQQQLKTDRQYINKLIKNRDISDKKIQILSISSKRDFNFKDNNKLNNLLQTNNQINQILAYQQQNKNSSVKSSEVSTNQLIGIEN